MFDKGFALFEVDTVISSCKSHSYDPTLVHLPSSQQLDLVHAIIQELFRDGTRVGCHHLLHLLEDKCTKKEVI